LCKAAAERGLYRALKELRQLEKTAKAASPGLDAASLEQLMGSFSQQDDEHDAWLTNLEKSLDLPPVQSGNRPQPPYLPPTGGGIDVPFAVGKRR
jgi:hypothetical protein